MSDRKFKLDETVVMHGDLVLLMGVKSFNFI
jgi:hypothetical protein